ncbi:MAG: lytic transglycosylase domain-containing protein [Rhodobacteraceae bacterium]|nr:lytic transglycosylase domain-containing protein [Paracoccaceae bacterium]
MLPRTLQRESFSLVLAVLLAVPVLIWAGPVTAQERPPPSREAGLLSLALGQGRAGDWEAGQAAIAGTGAEAQAVFDWFRLRDGGGTPAEADHWLRTRGHWPLPVTIQRAAEAHLADAAPEAVRAFFADRDPRSAEGALALLAALPDGAEADALAQRLWRDFTLTGTQEQALLERHADVLAPLHAERLEWLLWRGAGAGAERMLDRVDRGAARLAQARLGLKARAQGVNALIDAVPEALAGDPGLAHDRFQWRMHAGLTESAGDLLIERSALGAAGLGDPEAWARWRIFLVRGAVAEGDAARAYALATPHHLDDGAQFADLEWLAGFIALRHLDRPADALRHFRALRVRVSSPISLGRAGYWEGLAHEALGDPVAAEAAFAFAAEHTTSFYGQLAAERAGIGMDPALVADVTWPDWHETALANSDLLAAALLLRSAGEWFEARRLVMHLAWQLEAEAELGALSEFLLRLDEPNMALNVAKIAVQKGVLLPRAYFPLTGLENVALPAPADLVLAIARRESEFDPAVVSPADARGLMQVLPGTGAMMARELGINGFDPASLTTDPALNARLGAAYLRVLTEEFGPSLALVAAGYNAGPGRPRAWIERLGDPRNGDVDIVDWVESVPFAETRNYIMRVAESLVVYRTLLAGEPAPIAMEALLRGS